MTSVPPPPSSPDVEITKVAKKPRKLSKPKGKLFKLFGDKPGEVPLEVETARAGRQKGLGCCLLCCACWWLR
ncbi:hypothetical protein TrLO_g5230 [Triparma laevis f. longispina]|uniref:Uncharacterized protein n=1 Tax=Triparma laevis f. longispina TaxID=1714387 RepID=A0A9W7A957_9STRA|nr:hypothetical protein TrLO_g5230 [Triparma laevis f. longispina]